MKIIKRGLSYSELINYVRENGYNKKFIIIITNMNIIKLLFKLYGYEFEPNRCIGLQLMVDRNKLQPSSYIYNEEDLKKYKNNKKIEIIDVITERFIINR